MYKNKAVIILVEDDPVVFRMQEYIVEKESGIKPLWFKNGEEALDFLKKESKHLKGALILLDLNMPVMDGWEFLDACKARPFDLKIITIILTSSLFLADKQKSREYDIFGYQLKPLKRREFREIMQKPEVADLLYKSLDAPETASEFEDETT